MDTLSELIGQALVPALALGSVILYINGLQSRFAQITGRARELNREARELRADQRERMRSLRLQVTLMTHRWTMIRRAIMVLDASMFLFVLTILELLFLGLTGVNAPALAPALTFALGLSVLAIATYFCTREMSLSHRAILEDIRTSYELTQAEPSRPSSQPPEFSISPLVSAKASIGRETSG